MEALRVLARLRRHRLVWGSRSLRARFGPCLTERRELNHPSLLLPAQAAPQSPLGWWGCWVETPSYDLSHTRNRGGIDLTKAVMNRVLPQLITQLHGILHRRIVGCADPGLHVVKCLDF